MQKTKKECTTGQGTYIIVCLEITANYGLALNRPLGFSLSIKSSCPREIKDMTRELKRTYNTLQLLQSKVCYIIWIPRNVILKFKKITDTICRHFSFYVYFSFCNLFFLLITLTTWISFALSFCFVLCRWRGNISLSLCYCSLLTFWRTRTTSNWHSKDIIHSCFCIFL